MISKDIYFYVLRPMILLEKLNDKKQYRLQLMNKTSKKLKVMRKDYEYYTDLFYGESLSNSELLYFLSLKDSIPHLQKCLLQNFFKYRIINYRIQKLKDRYNV